jgi:hypothetical protein
LLVGDRGETAEVERWYRKAAEAGDTDAMFNLGVLAAGRGEAAEWYRKAAKGNT